MTANYRLITRSDLDGIVSAMLLKSRGMISDILFAHPKDIQDGVVDVGPRDILTCLPPHPKAGMVLSHRHQSGETLCPADHIVCNTEARSTTEVIYNHFGGMEAFPFLSPHLLAATRDINSARLSKQDILNPAGWTLLGYLTDSRTGLGRFRRFRISNYQLMLDLVDILRNTGDIGDILAHPDVAERVDMYREHAQAARAQIVRCARVHGPLVCVDLLDEDEIYVTNRFTVYALFPQCSLSLHILPGKQMRNVVMAVGKSILNPDNSTAIGDLMAEYGGGGHPAMGACQCEHAHAARIKEELIARLTSDNPMHNPAAAEPEAAAAMAGGRLSP